MNLERLRTNLDAIRSRIDQATNRSGRTPGSVTLVAVTKRNPAEWARGLCELGVHDLGENYPQELWEKSAEMASLPVRWHLIGHLQGNKARKTLPMVRMVHAVDSLKLLRSLDEMAAEMADPASVCLQVNTSAEASKHGWERGAILEDAEAIAACRHIPIVGLMTMAGYDTTPESARPCFVSLRELRDELRTRSSLRLEHLSMGMSGDFESAIEEGATLVRVGSALFEGVG